MAKKITAKKTTKKKSGTSRSATVKSTIQDSSIQKKTAKKDTGQKTAAAKAKEQKNTEKKQPVKKNILKKEAQQRTTVVKTSTKKNPSKNTIQKQKISIPFFNAEGAYNASSGKKPAEKTHPKKDETAKAVRKAEKHKNTSMNKEIHKKKRSDNYDCQKDLTGIYDPQVSLLEKEIHNQNFLRKELSMKESSKREVSMNEPSGKEEPYIKLIETQRQKKALTQITEPKEETSKNDSLGKEETKSNLSKKKLSKKESSDKESANKRGKKKDISKEEVSKSQPIQKADLTKETSSKNISKKEVSKKEISNKENFKKVCTNKMSLSKVPSNKELSEKEKEDKNVRKTEYTENKSQTSVKTEKTSIKDLDTAKHTVKKTVSGAKNSTLSSKKTLFSKDNTQDKKKNRFVIGFTVYMLCLFTVTMTGLMLLWMRMDVYEKSRPDKVMASLITTTSGAYWKSLLTEQGINEEFLKTLNLEEVSFSKKWQRYTENSPAYSIRFGDTDMLTVSLKPGRELSFGYHEWEIGEILLGGNTLCIYAPENAVIRIKGKETGKECMVQENAQPLSLGLFDANRKDIRGLAKYQLDTIYQMEDVTVEDTNGNQLELSYSSGNTYYYAPFMNDYKIMAPADCTVTVNGIVLTQDNAKIELCANEDFEGIEAYVSAIPQQTQYIVEGLIMPPEISVQTDSGETLPPSVEGTAYQYGTVPCDIPEQLSSYVMAAFDAYIAYSGNRGDDLSTNYNRYLSYLVPGSEAAHRAYQAQGSLQWVAGRDTKLRGANIKSYIPYSEELFTCKINFTMEGDEKEDANSYLFVFVKYNGAWKVARVLNKTAFLTS